MSKPDSIPPSSPASARSRAAEALLPRFIDRRRQDLALVADALERGDFEAIARIGHNMRGNGRSYGLPDIGAIGELLEAAADSRDAWAIQEQLAALGTCVERISQLPAAPRLESSTRVRAVTTETESPEGERERKR